MNKQTFDCIAALTKKANKLTVAARTDKNKAYNTLLHSTGIDRADALRKGTVAPKSNSYITKESIDKFLIEEGLMQQALRNAAKLKKKA